MTTAKFPETTIASKETIERVGYGVKGNIGGLPRKTYYTPDGRVIKAIASDRNYRKLVDGVWEEGVRDANLDKGWLTSMPTELKPYCSGCDQWHDTDEEVNACIEKKKAQVKKWLAYDAKIRKQGNVQTDDTEINELKGQLEELKDMMAKLLAANATSATSAIKQEDPNGKVL